MPHPAPHVSVVIPTYNGGNRLPIVLDALASQDVLDGSFNVIVVDNASTDDSARKIAAHASWRALCDKEIEGKIVCEVRQGAQYARLRGLRETSSPLVCFLDDDNVPALDYMRKGIDAMTDESVGLLVSRVVPQWAVSPSAAIARRSWLFAITDILGNEPIDFGAEASMVPSVTAGMWVRREAFLAAVPWQEPNAILPGRTGTALNCGEDIEIGLLIGRAGYRRIYVPGMRLEHLIPESRLGPAYLCRLIDGIVRSELTLGVRYQGYRYNFGSRASAAARLLGAAIAAPGVAVVRRDGLREALFILASRWAQVKGPYAQPVRLTKGGPERQQARQ